MFNFVFQVVTDMSKKPVSLIFCKSIQLLKFVYNGRKYISGARCKQEVKRMVIAVVLIIV